MADIVTRKINNTYMRVHADDSIFREAWEHFKVRIKDAHFNPKVKAKIWDGYIRYLSLKDRTMYVGLYKELIEFARLMEYSISIDPEILLFNKYTEQEARDFLTSIATFEPWDHQVDGFRKAIMYKRLVLDCSTSAGKSFMTYGLARFFDARMLIIVPKVDLVTQLYEDFKDYAQADNWDVEGNVHYIYGGQEKTTSKNITISTWQSIYDLPPEYFEEFDIVIGDEAHGFKATSLKEMVDACINAEYRIGLTGTVPDEETDRMTLKGCFGPFYHVIGQRELIERGHATDISPVSIVFNYPEEEKQKLRKDLTPGKKDGKVKQVREASKYQKEIDFLINNSRRNRILGNLIGKFPNENVLILYNNVITEHAEKVKKYVDHYHPGREVYIISGKVKKEERDRIKDLLEKKTGIILFATLKTFSTGISVKNLHKAFIIHPFKSQTTLVQSIGRMMRLHASKAKSYIYDIVDNLKYGAFTNPTYRHFIKRAAIYAKEGHELNIRKIDI